MANIANARLAFLTKPRYRTLANPHWRWSVRNVCSTLARTDNLRRLVSLLGHCRVTLAGLGIGLSLYRACFGRYVFDQYRSIFY